MSILSKPASTKPKAKIITWTADYGDRFLTGSTVADYGGGKYLLIDDHQGRAKANRTTITDRLETAKAARKASFDRLRGATPDEAKVINAEVLDAGTLVTSAETDLAMYDALGYALYGVGGLILLMVGALIGAGVS